MPHLALNNFNIILTLAGGLITLYGLVSMLLTETFYISDACAYLHYYRCYRKNSALSHTTLTH